MYKLIIAVLAALSLSACTPVTAVPIATPTTPVAPAPPSPTPARNPTAQPMPAEAQLPAPLFLLQGGQIARIEPDSFTRSIITAEQVQIPDLDPIATFTANAERLAYIVNDFEADRLMLTDLQGEAGVVRYNEAGHELSDVRFTPDGDALILRLLNNREPPDLPSGIYRLPLAAGPPELLVADDPVDDPVNPARTIGSYSPLAFAPDGRRLLVQVRSQFYEDCTLGVMAAAGGPVSRVDLPVGQIVYCGEEAWAADSSGFFFLAGPAEGDQAGPGLWRADPAARTPQPLLDDERFARAPHGMPGSAVRFMLTTLVRDPLGAISTITVTPAQVDQATRSVELLDAASDHMLRTTLWAPDGASLVAAFDSLERRANLRWYRLDGSPLDLPAADATIVELAWGL